MPNIEKPLTLKEAEKHFKTRGANKETPISINQRFHVQAEKEPEVKTRLVPVKRDEQKISWEVQVEINGVKAGGRALPGLLKGTPVKIGAREIDEQKLATQLTSFIPDHLGFNLSPLDIQKGIKTIQAALDDRRVPTTIFGADNRRTFRDTTYPWSTVGLVETNRGTGSGVMIGPRHLLTVSHVIDWTAPAGFAADWVRFTPSYFDGTAPFGVAYGEHIYWYVKEDGDGFISGNEGNFDYVVVVLDSRMGETTGWMGARGYDDAWDSLAAWSHMGYPGDLNGGQRPTWQGSFKVDGTDDAGQSMLHKADVFPGQSGGPVFGFWAGDVGPRAIAVQSWQNSSNNGASGGMDLRDLVAKARTEFA